MAKQQEKLVTKKAPIKKQTVKSSSDTTKIPTPYKMYNKVGSVIAYSRSAGDQDSTSKKAIYNSQVVDRARQKRNLEIANSNEKKGTEKKSLITRGNVFGNDSVVGSAFSTKGKTFKEAPLKSVKKKK